MTERERLCVFVLACIILPGGLIVLSLAIMSWIRYHKISIPKFAEIKFHAK